MFCFFIIFDCLDFSKKHYAYEMYSYFHNEEKEEVKEVKKEEEKEMS